MKYDDPYKDINFEIRRAVIKNKKGEVIFDEEVEFPDYFSDDAVNIVSSKYLCNEAKHKETSLKQMIDRVSETIADWGLKDGYFGENKEKGNEEYLEFLYKLKYYQTHQCFAFNSPVYFNCGVGSDKPQTSACYILDIEDDMESIMDSVKMESIIFKGGSGSGINMSPLRSSKERVRGGGLASGVPSFWKIADTAAGVIKSGGTLRRSAKLVCLDISHPDCMKFIYCKEREEKKMKALIEVGIEPEEGYEMSDEVFYQNTNISLVSPDVFMKAAEDSKSWWTRYVLDGEKCEKFNADDQLKEIAELAWRTGDPGLQFSDNINRWNTCANSGKIMSSNPCVTGDTLIATLCGKAIPIKELADSGKDVLVYAFDRESKEIKISKGVHPRKTGSNMPVYKITLDDGTTFRTTHNHKLILRNGESVEVRDLNIGDSLRSFSLQKQSNGDFNISSSQKRFVERKILDEYKYGRRVNYKIVSIDFDGYEDVYNITVDKYHTYVIITNITNDGITGIISRNCGEYMFLNNSSCNLASINLLKFFSKNENGNVVFDVETFEDIVNTVIIGQDILIDRSSFPSRKIANNSHNFRPLGLGYSNLGALFMWLGLPYDSEESRNIASLLTALLTGCAFKTSNKLAKLMQPFQKFDENKEPYYSVLGLHDYYVQKRLQQVSVAFSTKSKIVGDLANVVRDTWQDVRDFIKSEETFRNAQVTLLAPTGTISFLMDCTTKGVEPEYSLISYKTLSGSGGATIKIVNSIVKDALINLGYSNNDIENLCDELHSLGHFEKSEILKKEHLPIFDTAVSPDNGFRCIDYMGHVKMVAAVQPFLSGAVSKTINMHNNVTVEEICNLFKFAWKSGLKGITIYRDGSKTFQPLNKSISKEIKSLEEPKPSRKKLPADRPGHIHKFTIGSTKGYLMTGSYENGELGEMFLTVAKQGSTLSGLLDSLAIIISMCLQYGVPLRDIVSNLMYSKFDPSGITGNKDIRFSTSIVDYIARFLGIKYLSEEDKIELGLIKLGEDKKISSFIKKLPKTKYASSAPSCEVCGGIMQRLGTCYNCNNCGANTGSCG